MKERAIICRDEEVRAFLEGRKTQLRRPFVLPKFASLIEDQPVAVFPDASGLGWIAWYGRGPFSAEDTRARYPGPTREGVPCPFGVVGDRLWVREAWNMHGIMFGKPAAMARFASRRAYHYRATDDGQWRREWGGWRPATQMPRVVSRITLEIIDVCVERLQYITEEEATLEGFEMDFPVYTARGFFKDAWDREHGATRLSWDNNPFVWVIQTKVLHDARGDAFVEMSIDEGATWTRCLDWRDRLVLGDNNFGPWAVSHAVEIARVLWSQWCRCKVSKRPHRFLRIRVIDTVGVVVEQWPKACQP